MITLHLQSCYYTQLLHEVEFFFRSQSYASRPSGTDTLVGSLFYKDFSVTKLHSAADRVKSEL